MYVVTLPPSAATDPKGFAGRAQAAGADVLEIRGDLTPDVEPFASPLPILFAPRKAASRKPQAVSYLDLEHDEEFDIPKSTSVIRSYHNYKETPPLQELQGTLERLLALNADIVKIATTVNSFADILTIEELRTHVPKNQKHVMLGMGIKAHPQRAHSLFRNELTYTFVHGEDEAAPGQIPLSLYKLIEHCKRPMMFGLLGGPDVKSLSPQIHNSLFRAHGVDALFAALLTDDLEDAWNFIKPFGVAGLSVTTPWKKKVIPLLDELSPTAVELQSVNTVVLKEKRAHGFNVDWMGITEGYGFLKGAQSSAVIGSGGVVPAVIHACRACGIGDIRIFARNRIARKELQDRFGTRSFPLEDVKNFQPDVLICAINADIDLPVPDAKPNAHALDLRYGKRTIFLKKAAEGGYNCHDGLSMLMHQALAQFKLFTGINPSKDDLQLLTSLLQS